MALAPGARVAMACAMIATAGVITRAAVRADGALPEDEVRLHPHVRFYGNDVTETERSQIRECIGNT